MKRPFLYTFFFIVFQGSLHQLVDGTDGRWCGGWRWVIRSGQGLHSHHEFTGRGLSGFHVWGFSSGQADLGHLQFTGGSHV